MGCCLDTDCRMLDTGCCLLPGGYRFLAAPCRFMADACADCRLPGRQISDAERQVSGITHGLSGQFRPEQPLI